MKRCVIFNIRIISVVGLNMLLVLPLLAGWTKSSIGTVTNWAYGIAVGPGRNDGINRIYVASWSRLYEFSWNGTSWDRVDMGPTSGWEVALGEGKNDGIIRVYCTFTVVNPQYGGVYEFSWNGTSWDREVVCTFPSSPSSSAGHGIAVGPGRNDGRNRVYACDCNNNRTFESTWDGSSWVTNQAITDWSGIEITIGPGRNDNIQRLYFGKQGSQLREYTWAGSGWVFMNLDSVSSRYRKVWIGPGRNDGRNRVYTGHDVTPTALYEFSWNGSGWDKVLIGSMPNLPNCITGGPGRNDGINRIYSGTTGGMRYALEYTWNGSGWDSTWVDGEGASGVAYCDAVVADARNDGVKRLYMTSSNSNIYEFIYTAEVAEEYPKIPRNDVVLKIYPNPFREKVVIDWATQQIDVNSKISVNIFDVAGRRIKSFDLRLAKASIIWDGKDDQGQSLQSGVYYIIFESPNFRTQDKLILMR